MGNTMIIQNARVISPERGTVEKRPLYIRNGKLVPFLEEEGIPVLDAGGCYAAPGFVDSHVHVFERRGVISIPADRVGIEQGVVTVVDAGSTGIRDFPYFQKEIIEGNITDVRFFLNIAHSGLCDGLSELSDPAELMTLAELLAFQLEHGSHLVGLKVRMSGSVVKEQELEPLRYARELSDKSGLPLMIHIGNAPPRLDAVLNLLREGDIVTHCFHGKTGGIPDNAEAFRAAAKRGVRFDVGHGAASFSADTVQRVLELSPVDFSISTDVYDKNFESPVGSLMDTMTKFLALGFALEDLVRRVTTLPRRFLRLPAAELQAGQAADITLFRLVEENRTLVDSEGKAIPAERSIRPAATILKGKKVWSNEL